MIIRYDPDFLDTLKKAKVNIRKSFKEAMVVFYYNSHDSRLNNHPLKGEWKGSCSIDVTSNWRAIYTEKQEGKDIVAYFVAIGTHEQLYK